MSRARVQQARNLLDFLAHTVATENTPYSQLLKTELESLQAEPTTISTTNTSKT